MNEPERNAQIEPRWPAALAIVAVLALFAALPERLKLFPRPTPYIFGFALIALMAGVGLTRGTPWWLRAERRYLLLVVVLLILGDLQALTMLVRAMVRRSTEVGGVALLASSIAVWVSNVLAFSLLYWQIDRGGPESRVNQRGIRPDWQFPQTGAPDDAPPGWRPTFVDYLFLGFSTATAFSPTDALPLTSRAKLLMMLESVISLVTIVVVGARAINILGS